MANMGNPQRHRIYRAGGKDSQEEYERGESHDAPMPPPHNGAPALPRQNLIHIFSRTSNINVVSPPFDQLRARSSRTPRPILRRISVRSVTPSAYPTWAAIWSMLALLVCSRCTARSTRRS